MSQQLIPSAQVTDLSEAERAEIDAEIAHAPYRSAVGIDALKIIQSHRRWVSDDALAALADYLEMSAAELDGIATFYNLIFRRPVGENVILVFLVDPQVSNNVPMDALRPEPWVDSGSM